MRVFYATCVVLPMASGEWWIIANPVRPSRGPRNRSPRGSLRQIFLKFFGRRSESSARHVLVTFTDSRCARSAPRIPVVNAMPKNRFESRPCVAISTQTLAIQGFAQVGPFHRWTAHANVIRRGRCSIEMSHRRIIGDPRKVSRCSNGA